MSGNEISAEDLLNNPDAIDLNDEEAILAIANGADTVELKDFDAEDEGQAAAAPGGDEEKATDLSDKGTDTESGKDSDKSVDDGEVETPAPIQSKSGKHTIPYSVLDGTRQRLQSATDTIDQQAQEIERLRSLVKSGGEGATDEELEEAAHTASTPDEEFERKNGMAYDDFKKEYGETLAKSLMAQAEESLEMRQQLNTLMETHTSQVEEEETREAVTVQEAIDAIPALAALQAEGGDKWKEAIQVDNVMKALPRYRDNPDDLMGRFTAVAKELGLELPTDDNSRSEKRTETKKADDDETLSPKSISDLPGGSAAAQSEQEALENMDAADIGFKFENMTAAQQEEYLNSL